RGVAAARPHRAIFHLSGADLLPGTIWRSIALLVLPGKNAGGRLADPGDAPVRSGNALGVELGGGRRRSGGVCDLDRHFRRVDDAEFALGKTGRSASAGRAAPMLEPQRAIWRRFRADVADGWDTNRRLHPRRPAAGGGVLPLVFVSLRCPTGLFVRAAELVLLDALSGHGSRLWFFPQRMAGGYPVRRGISMAGDSQEPAGRCDDGTRHHKLPARRVGGLARRLALLVDFHSRQQPGLYLATTSMCR